MTLSIKKIVPIILFASSICFCGCGRRRATKQEVSQLPSTTKESPIQEAVSTPKELPPEPVTTIEEKVIEAIEVKPEPKPVTKQKPITVAAKTITARTRCHFELDLATLNSRAQDRINVFMAGIPPTRISKVYLEGHCCEIGTVLHNERLGKQRANAVASYLSRTYGIPENKFHQASFGRRKPIASNATTAGREKNRRTELRIIYKKD